MRTRLDAATLSGSRPDAVAGYDRTGPQAIVHLGVGAFMRAHLCSYAEDLLRTGWPARIHGVSLRSDRAQLQLEPQDCLFSVTVREPEEDPSPHVVGSLTAVSTGPPAAIAAIAAPETRLVTLTVTEKGYADTTGEGQRAPSVPGVIAAGLASRGRALPAPVFAPLDNLVANGEVLRHAVLEAAAATDTDLAAWIRDEVRFASSVVDRLVPAPTADDLDLVESLLGLRDEAAVVCERHRSWAISRVDGLPPLEDAGVVVVDDVGPFERRKLRLLNGPHSALAYAGLVTGCTTIAEAAAHPLAGPFASRIADAAVGVCDPAEIDPASDFAASSLRRFRNAALGHTCSQVGADGSEKLRQRILPVALERLGRGLDVGEHAVLFACWLACASGMQVNGVEIPAVDDPAARSLRAALVSGGPELLATRALGAGAPRKLLESVSTEVDRLRRVGALVLEVRP